MYFTELFQSLRARDGERFLMSNMVYCELRSVLDPEKALGRLSHRRIVICREAGSSSSCWARLFISIRKFGFCRVNCELMKYIRLEEAPASRQFRIRNISTYFGVIQRSKGGGGGMSEFRLNIPSAGLYIYKSSGSINFSYLRKHIYKTAATITLFIT